MHQNNDKQFNSCEVRAVGCLLGGILGPLERVMHFVHLEYVS